MDRYYVGILMYVKNKFEGQKEEHHSPNQTKNMVSEILYNYNIREESYIDFIIKELEKDGVFIPKRFDIVMNSPTPNIPKFKASRRFTFLNIYNIDRINTLIRKYKLKNIFQDE